MAKTKSKEKQSSEFYENPEVLAEQLSKTEEFIENNKKVVFGLGGIIALIIVAFFGYRYYMNNLNEEAQNEMFQAVYWFENEEYDLALNGDGNNFGFLAIEEDFASTKAANLSKFYIGTIYLQQGKFEMAIEYLKDFNSDDLLVQARAYALVGDAYMELGNYADAASHYGESANYKSNKEFSSIYLMKQGLAYEKANDVEAAIESYQKIVDEFSKSRQKIEAEKYLARLEAQQ